MEDQEKLLENLQFLGLTRTQSRVYVASLKLNNATATQISQLAGLNVAVTYRRIKELLGLDLIEIRLGSPNRYSATDPVRALRGLLEKSESEVKFRRHLVGELERSLTAMADQKSNTMENGYEHKVAYRLLAGRDRLFDESRRLREETSRELLLIIPSLGLRRLVRHGYVQEVTQCLRRGVTVKIITEITDSNALESDQLAGLVSLRHYPKISFRLGIYDRETLHIGAAYDDDPSSDGSKDVYLVISDRALASSMALMFDAIWDRSARCEPVLKRLRVPA